MKFLLLGLLTFSLQSMAQEQSSQDQSPDTKILDLISSSTMVKAQMIFDRYYEPQNNETLEIDPKVFPDGVCGSCHTTDGNLSWRNQGWRQGHIFLSLVTKEKQPLNINIPIRAMLDQQGVLAGYMSKIETLNIYGLKNKSLEALFGKYTGFDINICSIGIEGYLNDQIKLLSTNPIDAGIGIDVAQSTLEVFPGNIAESTIDTVDLKLEGIDYKVNYDLIKNIQFDN